MTDEERQAEARADLTSIFGDQVPLHGRLTLHEAFARALAYNLDNRVKLMEAAVASNDLDISKYDMLPRLVANAGYSWRSNVDASSSQSVLTGQQSLEPSTSTDRNLRTADLTLSWNILDFGVSYYTAKQNANRVLIAEEQRRRVVDNLLQDVRRAFWRAAAAQALDGQVRDAIASARSGLSTAQRVESEGLRSPVDVLRYQRTLLDLVRQLEATERDLAVAKTELAVLINLPIGARYTLAVPGNLKIERTHMPIRQMEQVALLRNPDLRESSYNARITAEESRKVLLRLLPGINLNYGPNWDSNSFLVNNNWYALAARLSGNIIQLVQLPQQMQRAENNELLAARRRQALSVAVLGKVHIAYEQYLSAANVYQWASQLASVDHRLYQQLTNRATNDAQGELEKISAQANAVASALQRYQAYAEAQAALGRLYAAVGLDPVTQEQAETLDLKLLRRSLRAAERKPVEAPTASTATASASPIAAAPEAQPAEAVSGRTVAEVPQPAAVASSAAAPAAPAAVATASITDRPVSKSSTAEAIKDMPMPRPRPATAGGTAMLIAPSPSAESRKSTPMVLSSVAAAN